jgi:GT2 family glycosyltransferase
MVPIRTLALELSERGHVAEILAQPTGGGADKAVRERYLLTFHGVAMALSGTVAGPREALEACADEAVARIAGHLVEDGLAPAAAGRSARSLLSADSVEVGPCPGTEIGDDAPMASVIVPTIRADDGVEAMLRSVVKLRYPRFEVVIVDNGPSRPGVRELVDEIGDSRVRYVAEPRKGSSIARNTGIAAARGEIQAFTDDDAVADPDWLSRIVRAFTLYPDVTCVTGIVLADELVTPAQEWFEGNSAGFSKGLDAIFFSRDMAEKPNPLFPFDGSVMGAGNNVAFRRETLASIGGFDVRLGAGSRGRAGADIDALTKVIMSGGRVLYLPSALVWHRHRETVEALRQQMFNYGVGFTGMLTKWALRYPGVVLSGVRAYRKSQAVPVQRRLAEPGLVDDRKMRRSERLGWAVGPAFFARSAFLERWGGPRRTDG